MSTELIIAISSLTASSITGIIAFLMYKQNQNLSRQTKALEDEQKRRSRPWLKIIPTTYHETQSRLEATLKIENIGKMPAKTVYSKVYASPTKFDRDELWEKGITKDVFSILPNETQSFIVDLDTNFLKATENTPMYFGIHVAYDTDDGFKTIGKIWKELGRDRYDMDYWIDEEPED